MSDTRKTGTVARLFRDRVFGFITCPADARDYFFHQAQLEDCTFAQIAEGSELSFVVVEGPKGVEAQEVRLVDRQTVPIQGHETRAQVGMPEYKPTGRKGKR